MYRKKGGKEKEEYKQVQEAGIGALKVYTINEPDLESGTTYVVRVKTHSEYSGRFSDSSEELEFTTPASPYGLVLVLIISLSIASVLISSVIFGCYVKLKTQWWDTISKGPNPKLLDMHPYVQQFLKPESTIISSTCVEPLITDDGKPWLKGSVTDTSSGSFQQSSGISSGSSCLSYANTEPADIIAGVHDALGKAFPNISPVSPMTTNLATDSNKDCCLFPAPDVSSHVIADDVNSGSSGFDNKTYAIVIPSSSPQIILDKSEAQTQATMVCVSAYHPSEDNTVACPDQQVPAGLLLNLATEASILMPSDMSYQPCSADAGPLSYAEESSENSICSGTTTTTICDAVTDVEAECASFNDWDSDPTKTNGKSGEVTVCDDNPCYGHLPAGSWSLPPVVDDYQAFQSLVGQPGVSFSEERSDEKEEHLDKYPVGSFTSIPPVPTGCINTMEGDQTFSELERPFWSLMASDQPMRVITDSGYQCV
ncbi:hypothetical protein INR49_031755 [Caranx melampygus]|nr:hypothetical protein INR49_031755 [Caranx melampygus]